MKRKPARVRRQHRAGVPARMRERLDEHGAGALDDHELLAMVAGIAVDDADGVITAFGGTARLGHRGRTELARQPGIGPAKASRIIAAIELGRRTTAHAPARGNTIRSPHSVRNWLRARYGNSGVEQLGVICLDTKQRVISSRILTKGTADGTYGEPRDIFGEAIRAGARHVIVFHNHPSGDTAPSVDDVQLTARLAEAGLLLGVDLLDHLILSATDSYSMREAGRL